MKIMLGEALERPEQIALEPVRQKPERINLKLFNYEKFDLYSVRISFDGMQQPRKK
jgi:hypothetical protein